MTDDVFQKAQEGLTAHSENERKEAVLTLLKLKDRRAIDLLAKLCEMDRSAEVRTQARKAYYLLRDIHPNKLDEPFLELPDGISFDDLEKLLVDENPRIRREAIKLAGKLDPQSTAPPCAGQSPWKRVLSFRSASCLASGGRVSSMTSPRSPSF